MHKNLEKEAKTEEVEANNSDPKYAIKYTYKQKQTHLHTHIFISIHREVKIMIFNQRISEKILHIDDSNHSIMYTISITRLQFCMQ